jgi:predicted AlkP superfamily phosphohydrolase/phosphomutase
MRTLFIGIDGATFDVLDALAAPVDGREPVMPFLAHIYRSGARSILRSTPNPLTPPAWVSLMTGKNPGKHGVFDFIRAEDRGDQVFFTLYDSRDCLAESIWSIAGRQGRTVGALNFPFTAPPPENLNGFLVPGFVPWRHLRRNTAPSDLFDLLKTLPGFDLKGLAWDFDLEKRAVDDLSDEDRERFVRYHLPREKQWFEIARHLMKGKNPDLMAIMFDGVDKLQHQAWSFIAGRARNGGEGAYDRRMHGLCMDYFRQLDGFIEALVEDAGPDAQVFLASDHGFTTTTEVVRINTYLEQKGHLKWKSTADTPEAARREDSMFANLDWEATTAYCPTGSSNGVTIRVSGGSGRPGVEPKDYEPFRDRLVEELRELRDPRTGEPVVTGVFKREEVYEGPATSRAPDILLVLRDFGFVSIKNKAPVVERRRCEAGTHHPEGVFLAVGGGIKKGERTGPRDIVDVCATLLYSLGLEVPSDLDGRVAEEFFTEDRLKRNPVVIGSATSGPAGDKEAEYTTDEEKIKEQLRMLGYL